MIYGTADRATRATAQTPAGLGRGLSCEVLAANVVPAGGHAQVTAQTACLSWSLALSFSVNAECRVLPVCRSSMPSEICQIP